MYNDFPHSHPIPLSLFLSPLSLSSAVCRSLLSLSPSLSFTPLSLYLSVFHSSLSLPLSVCLPPLSALPDAVRSEDRQKLAKERREEKARYLGKCAGRNPGAPPGGRGPVLLFCECPVVQLHVDCTCSSTGTTRKNPAVMWIWHQIWVWSWKQGQNF